MFGLISIGTNPLLESSVSQKDFYFKQELTVISKENSNFQSPEFCLIQKDSLINNSPLNIVIPQILAVSAENDINGTGEGKGTELRDGIVEYAVQTNDNLSLIASKFGITIDSVCGPNELNKNSVLKIGQKLIILPVSGTMHLVKKDETLIEIAQKYKGDVDKIIAFNKIAADQRIYIGDILIIPGGIMPVPVKINYSDSSVSSSYSEQTPIADSYFIFPTVGQITQGLHPYNAIDIANKCGTPVYAAAGGSIQRSGYQRISGNYIRILHPNSVVTLYGHLSKMLVSEGQTVSQGQIIGYIGNTGYVIGATGCHLHFEVRGAKNFLAQYPVGSKIGW